MKTVFSAAMRRATQLTRAQNVIEATQVIRRAYRARSSPSPSEQSSESLPLLAPQPTTRQPDAFEQLRLDAGLQAVARETLPPNSVRRADEEAVGRSFDAVASSQSFGFGHDPRRSRNHQSASVQFRMGGLSHSHLLLRSGFRDYKVYVPARGRPEASLIIMLHGCTQNPTTSRRALA